MKKSVLVILLAILCCAPAFAQKRSKKSKNAEPAPAVVTFKAAGSEEFILYFGGKQINKKPQTSVSVTKAELNTEYNVRIVIKTPRVGSDMDWNTVSVKKMGEEWVVYANRSKDKAELMSSEVYDKRYGHKPIPISPKVKNTQDRDKSTLLFPANTEK